MLYNKPTIHPPMDGSPTTKGKEMKFKPLAGKVFVTDMKYGERTTKAGIILLNDDGREEGVRDRWGKIYCCGDDCEGAEELIGQWIYIVHGRWSRKIEFDGQTMWMIDWPDCALCVTDEEPLDEYVKESYQYI